MIVTSNAYKAMMRGRRVSSRMSVKITSGEDEYVLGNDDLVRNSFSINWRSSNNGAFSLGTAYSSSLDFSSFVSVEPEIDGQFVTIEPTVYYKVDALTEVGFPLGVFRCDSPKVFSKTTSYECYDLMICFDKRVENRFSGTPYNCLTYICSECGQTLGNTATQISRMINSTLSITIDPERVQTYRDALSYIAIILGGYCIMNRSGALEIRQFHQTSDMELVRHRRKHTTFGGYKTVFSGVQCRFLAEQNFYPYEVIDPDAEGIVLDLGDIPVIENTETVKHNILSNIYNLLSGIEYYPCEIEMVGDPSIEAGDMITTKDRYGYDRDILLTSVTYQWRASASIVSEGSDPKLVAVSTAEKKAQASQEASQKASQIVTTTYVNADTITLGTTDTMITSLRFVTNKELTAIFGSEIPVYSDGDGYVEITYLDSGIERDVVKARVQAGYNLITLVNHLYYEKDVISNLQLQAHTEAIGSGSAPSVTIAQNTIRSYVFAQGIETEAEWDGIILITESISPIETAMQIQGLSDGLSVYVTSEDTSILSALVSAYVPEVQIESVSDTMTIEFEYGDHILRCGQGNRCGAGRMFAPITV